MKRRERMSEKKCNYDSCHESQKGISKFILNSDSMWWAKCVTAFTGYIVHKSVCGVHNKIVKDKKMYFCTCNAHRRGPGKKRMFASDQVCGEDDKNKDRRERRARRPLVRRCTRETDYEEQRNKNIDREKKKRQTDCRTSCSFRYLLWFSVAS